MAMNKTVFYKKVGRKYVAVSEYDPELTEALPYGTHVQVCSQNGKSRRYNVDPALIPMVAACMLLQHDMSDIIVKASEFKPPSEPVTEKQMAAWKNLQKEFGGLTTLYGPSFHDVGQKVLDAISAKAVELLTNDALREQYEHFITLAKLSQESSK